MEKTEPLITAIYARISSDSGGEGLGVDRQVAESRKLAKRLGWIVGPVFIDNDKSAYSGKLRPEYRALLDAVKAGEVQGIIALHPDRLHRRMTELEEFISLVERHGTQIQTVQAGEYDLSTPTGQMIARILGSVAQGEVAHGRERLKLAKAQAAAQGKYRGGIRPFGFEADGLTVRESEAKIIRETTAAVLAGRTLASISRELNERGVTGTKGKPITFNNLRDMLLRPRNAGILAHGLPNRNSATNTTTRPYEEVGPAAWPAIVPEDQWRALVTVLTDPERRTSTSKETRWLGSGIYRCAVPVLGEDGKEHPCGAVLRTAPHGGTAKKTFKRRYLYRCTDRAHLTVAQEATDEFVRQVMAIKVRDPLVQAALHPDDGKLAAARESRSVLAVRLAQVERDYDEDIIDGRRYAAKRDKVLAELAEVDARMGAALSRSAVSSILSAIDPGQAFLDAPIDLQRAMLAIVMTVEVLPSLSRGTTWSSDRLRITPVGRDR